MSSPDDYPWPADYETQFGPINSSMRRYLITVEDTKNNCEITHEITSYSPVRALEHAVNNTRILMENGSLGEEWR